MTDAATKNNLVTLPSCALVALLTYGCGVQGTPSTPELVSRSDEIIGGTVDYVHTNVVEVVAITPSGQQATCSGEFVSTKEVLTAAHCITEPPIGGQAAFFVFPQTDARGLPISSAYPVVGGAIHPLWDGNPVHGNDAAILRLAIPVPGMSPVWLNRYDIPPVAFPLTFVGYGAINVQGDDVGVRRTTSAPLTGLDSTIIQSNFPQHTICFGDSGGPAFITNSQGQERMVGITSFTHGCQVANSTRVDAVKGFIAQNINTFFVEGLYRRVLGRVADDGGRNGWVYYLDSGASKHQVALGVINSIESRSRLVNYYYQVLLHRPAGLSELPDWIGLSIRDIIAGIAGSLEYWNLHDPHTVGPGTDFQGFIEGMCFDLLHTGDPNACWSSPPPPYANSWWSGGWYDYYLGNLTSGDTRAQRIYQIARAFEYSDRRKRSEVVEAFQNFLLRNPADYEVSGWASLPLTLEDLWAGILESWEFNQGPAASDL
jgi:hypothetical protein